MQFDMFRVLSHNWMAHLVYNVVPIYTEPCTVSFSTNMDFTKSELNIEFETL